jgi:hypothetical protein
VFGCGGDATAIGSGDDVSLHLQGVEGDEGGGVDQSMTRGLGEGSSPEGIGGGEFRRRCGQTVMSSQEEGGGVLCLKRSHTDEGETERSTMATLSHREEKMGPAQRALRRRRGVSGRHDVAVGVVGTWHW